MEIISLMTGILKRARLLRRHRALSMRIDGFLTMIGATVVFAASAGLTYFYCCHRVHRTARDASSSFGAGDIAVVFGQRLDRAGRPGPDYVERLERARDAAAGDIWILGGQTSSDAALSEAAAGKMWLLGQDVPENRIQTEEASLHTLENLSLLRTQIGSAETSVTLVSNRYHLERIGVMAQGMGMRHTVCAAEPGPRAGPRYVTKVAVEAYFLHWYFVGRTIARALRNKHMLDRIT